jgi:sirohydrochlorin cobaltochelatase
MKIKAWLALGIALFIFSAVGSGIAHGAHGEKRAMKKGILLVAFGTSIPEAEKAFKNIERRARAAYPEIPIRWAYTSSIIRHKLAKEGKQIDSVEVALAKMMDEEFTHVAVQSLHTIGGQEYHELRRNAHLFGQMAGGFDRIVVGYPLLATERDMQRVTEILLQVIPRERRAEDAVVLMGHGTHHPSNAFYAALMYHLQMRDPNVFVGTVEGAPGIEDIKEILLERGIKKAYLMPFMSVAGDHAINDMAGKEEDSWQSILTSAGIESVSILKGTAEFDEIVDVWIDHLRGPLSHF